MIFDITKEQFSKEVENCAKNDKVSETPYIDSVIKILEKYSLDASQANKMLSKPILEKIESENMQYNIVRVKKNKLLFA